MALEKETVALPFTSGIQPNTRARLLNPDKLLVAENCQYVLDQGPQKRNGHVGRVVRSSKPYTDLAGTAIPTAAPARETFSTANPHLPASWLYGWGVRGVEKAQDLLNFETSPYPDVGQLFGSVARDDEALAWDGFRLFSYTPGQTAKFGEVSKADAGTDTTATNRRPCCFPALRTTPQAKISTAQLSPEACDNGVARLIAWVNPGATSFSYSVFDSSSGAVIVLNQTVTKSAIKEFRCISVGQWFHIICADSGANSLDVRSFHQDNLTATTTISLGTVDNVFDVRKFDETKFIVARLKVGVISATILNSDGTVSSTFVPNLTGHTAVTNGPIALNIQDDGNIGLLWLSGSTPFNLCFDIFTQSGVEKSGDFGILNAEVVAARRLTLAPRVVHFQTQPDDPIWTAYVEDLVGGVQRVTAYTIAPGAGFQTSYIRHRVVLASHAMSVGNRTYTWVANSLVGAIGLQTTWFLVDDTVLPVGKMSYGQAAADLAGTTYGLTSVNWHVDDPAHPFKDRIVFHGALGYFQRVPSSGSVTSSTPNGVFAEQSINFYELDFLPKLRAAQAGRCAYIAGAQLWAYDGTEAVEAEFHAAPEGVTVVAGAGGSLSTGTYRWRVDLCHKNAQNEEVRSWSIVTSPVAITAGQKATVTIPTCPMTRRPNAYFLIFRTEANGTVYYLTNSRDPSSANFVLNNLANTSVTYDDTLADASLIAREYHPANAGGNYIDPLPPPACEIVAAGRGRLWLAGGELARGEVAPSRLFSPGQAPAFSPALNIQIDRNFEPITAIGFIGDIGAIFRRTSAYVLDSDGPDNSLVGGWSDPRLALAETGCVAQETLAMTSVGLWFQSPAGIRLLGSSGAMDRQAGIDVDVLAVHGNYAGTVVVPENMQVRWYSRDVSKPTLVLDYSSNSWVTWTGVTAVGSVFWPVSNFAILAKGDGYIWEEREGEITDNGNPIQMRVQVAWLHSAQLGDFQRWRRFAVFGRAAIGARLSVKTYFDEREFHDEEFTVQMPDTADGITGGDQFNATVWGNSGSFGLLGPWGDESVATAEHGSGLWFRDGVFRFRKMPRRQKCSVFSLSISDDGMTSGFEPVVLALEISKKPGLDRIPNSTNSLA